LGTMKQRPLFLSLVAVGALTGLASAQEVDLSDIGYVLGSEEAPITVVEMGDFACSACALFHQTTWRDILAEYIEEGTVVWRHVPFVLGFPKGDDATKAAECAADQGQYWEMHDVLFARQAHWTEPRNPKDTLVGYAAELGLDVEAFETCYDKNHGKDRTKRANRAAKELGVRATPTFYINGFRIQGALPTEAFREILTSLSAPSSR